MGDYNGIAKCADAHVRMDFLVKSPVKHGRIVRSRCKVDHNFRSVLLKNAVLLHGAEDAVAETAELMPGPADIIEVMALLHDEIINLLRAEAREITQKGDGN